MIYQELNRDRNVDWFSDPSAKAVLVQASVSLGPLSDGNAKK